MDPPLDFPSAFNGTGRHMLHSRIAIWHPSQNSYQVYIVNRENWPTVQLTPTNTDRTSPFYFAEGPGDRQSRNVTIHMPRARVHSHVTMAIWHTGGWLCRRTGNRKEPVMPLLAVSDPAKLQYQGNVGLHECPEYWEWLPFQTPVFNRAIIANRIVGVADPEPVFLTAPPEPIPLFVAEALLSNTECPITMDPVQKGAAAVTSCFHVFQRDAIEQWLEKHNTCPVCKKTCVATMC